MCPTGSDVFDLDSIQLKCDLGYPKCGNCIHGEKECVDVPRTKRARRVLYSSIVNPGCTERFNVL